MKYFSVLSLLYEFLKTYPITVGLVVLLNCFHYLRTIIIPKNISKITLATTNSSIDINKLIIVTMVQVVILLIGMSLYEFADVRLHEAIQDFHLSKFFHSLFDNREKSLHKPITPSVYSNIVSYTNGINDLSSSFFLIFPLLVTIAGLLHFIYQHDFKCFIISGIVIGISFGYLIYCGKKIKDYALIYNKKKDELIDMNDDINNNIINVLSFDQRSSEKKNITQKIKEYLHYFRIYNLFKILFLESFSLTSTMLLIFVLFMFYKKMLIGTLSKGVFAESIVIFISFMISTLIKDMNNISRLFYKYGKTKNCLNSINRYYVKDPDILKRTFSVNNDNFIDIQNISYSIEGNQILKNLSLGINNNEFTCIQGKIGSGKSSLINIIFGIRYLDDGHIIINNNDINSTTTETWKKQFHYCSQHPVLFNRSVSDNIFYGDSHNIDKLYDIANKLNIKDLIDKLIKKENFVGSGGYKLSGGERQVISILRIALQPKPIIILDEPTASLDKFHKIIVCKIIEYIKNTHQVCILGVSHDIDLINSADRIITLEHGKIVRDVINNKNIKKL
ncbi:ABC transporter [seawater metagenome]|uniref:ABC transporter n=1 Tax=seawater metagenome TaxID=1561972 RepID=A0A5E8CJB3_9ZZZZ